MIKEIQKISSKYHLMDVSSCRKFSAGRWLEVTFFRLHVRHFWVVIFIQVKKFEPDWVSFNITWRPRLKWVLFWAVTDFFKHNTGCSRHEEDYESFPLFVISHLCRFRFLHPMFWCTERSGLCQDVLIDHVCCRPSWPMVLNELFIIYPECAVRRFDYVTSLILVNGS